MRNTFEELYKERRLQSKKEKGAKRVRAIVRHFTGSDTLVFLRHLQCKGRFWGLFTLAASGGSGAWQGAGLMLSSLV